MPAIHPPRESSLRQSLLAALWLTWLLSSGCANTPSPADANTNDSSSPSPIDSATYIHDPLQPQGDTDGAAPLDPAVEALLQSLTVESAQREGEARQRLAVARRLAHDLDLARARKEAQISYALNPTAEARKLLNEIGFMMGDRRQEVALLTEDWANGEKVKRQATVNELRTLLAEGEQLLNAGKPTEAAKNFQRVIDLIQWFHEDGETLTPELHELNRSAKEKLHP